MDNKTVMVLMVLILGLILTALIAAASLPGSSNVATNATEHATFVWWSEMFSVREHGGYTVYITKVHIPEDNVTCYVSGVSDGISCIEGIR